MQHEDLNDVVINTKQGTFIAANRRKAQLVSYIPCTLNLGGV